MSRFVLKMHHNQYPGFFFMTILNRMFSKIFLLRMSYKTSCVYLIHFQDEIVHLFFLLKVLSICKFNFEIPKVWLNWVKNEILFANIFIKSTGDSFNIYNPRGLFQYLFFVFLLYFNFCFFHFFLNFIPSFFLFMINF